jgi:hypothetical protein
MAQQSLCMIEVLTGQYCAEEAKIAQTGKKKC